MINLLRNEITRARGLRLMESLLFYVARGGFTPPKNTNPWVDAKAVAEKIQHSTSKIRLEAKFDGNIGFTTEFVCDLWTHRCQEVHVKFIYGDWVFLAPFEGLSLREPPK